jgi:hypothetical protein
VRHELTLAILGLAWSLPVGAEVEVLFEGTSTDDWSTARDAERLRSEFAVSEVRGDEAQEGVVWRFVPRPGTGFNDLFLMRPVERDFDVLRVQIRNEGEPFTLAAKVRGADAAEWTANQVSLKSGPEPQWVEFPRAEWKVAGWSRDADGRLDLPLGSFTVIAFGVQPEREYRVTILRVEAERPDPPVATVTRLTLPRRLKAGQTYPANLEFTLDRPCRESRAELQLVRAKAVVARVPLPLPKALTEVEPGETTRVEGLQVPVPRYAHAGTHAFRLRIGEARVVQKGADLSRGGLEVTIEARNPGHTRAEVRLHNGVPTLFINGEPHNGMAYAAYGPSVEVFSDFAHAGVDLFTFSATPTEAGYGLSVTTWTAPDTYDYSQLDERVMMVLQANPDAYFFPRLYVHAPKWWSEQHPDDTVLMDPGDGKPVPFIHAGGKPAPSWASEAWRQDTIEGLRRLIAHVESSPYADRVVGYHIASGTTEEWMMWGGNENEWVDYSPVNTQRFREWLRSRYGTDAALQKAWAQADVTLVTAAIPLKAARGSTALGALRDPTREQAVIDYYLYNSAMTADTICALARAVKQITRREKTVGIFYGYLLQLCGEQRQQNAGHLALGQVLASPDVDFVCSPTSYAFRQLGGEGTSHFMSLLSSVQQHGKLWFDENDIRTSLSGGQVGEWGRPADVVGDRLQQDKELANVIVNGTAQWWFDVGGNRYNDPALMRRIGELATCAGQALDLDRSPRDEVALIVDEASLCYLRVGDPLGNWLLIGQLPALHRIGAPVGHYLTSDLPAIGNRKLFLIPTSFAPSQADRAAIDALKRDGHVLVFLYVPGLYREGQIMESAMTDLTGIELKLSREPARLRVTLQGGHALTEGLDGATYGVDHETLPIAYADDEEAATLGRLPDGKPGLVVKGFGDWTAVHSVAPLLPTRLLRNLARLAGAHTYLDTDDVVWASESLVGVCAHEGGRRTVRLPKTATVDDLYTGENVAQGVATFEADFEPRGTRVFVTR